MHANWLFQKSAPIILPVNLGSLGACMCPCVLWPLIALRALTFEGGDKRLLRALTRLSVIEPHGLMYTARGRVLTSPSLVCLVFYHPLCTCSYTHPYNITSHRLPSPLRVRRHLPEHRPYPDRRRRLDAEDGASVFFSCLRCVLCPIYLLANACQSITFMSLTRNPTPHPSYVT